MLYCCSCRCRTHRRRWSYNDVATESATMNFYSKEKKNEMRVFWCVCRYVYNVQTCRHEVHANVHYGDVEKICLAHLCNAQRLY